MIYSFDIALSTHKLLKEGICEAALTRVVVEADDDVDAQLLACQLAHAVHGHAMVTAAYMRV